MAPYSAKSLFSVEMQHLRLMYPRSRRLVSWWLVEHAHAATSEYDSNPTSLRHMSRGSLPNRQSEVAADTGATASDLQLSVGGASLVLIFSNAVLSSPFPLCESSAGRAALLSSDTGVAAPPKSMVVEDALPLPSLPLPPTLSLTFGHNDANGEEQFEFVTRESERERGRQRRGAGPCVE